MEHHNGSVEMKSDIGKGTKAITTGARCLRDQPASEPLYPEAIGSRYAALSLGPAEGHSTE
jgi:hypothetical protein